MRELDILFMEAGDAIDKYNDQMLISFMEGANPPKTDGIITKIKKLVESVIKKIKDFFEGKKTKDNIDKIEKAIKANPSLKNEKVKVKDYSKVEKLDKETSAKLNKCKTKEEAERLMDKYDKQRKALLVALPVVTISVAGVLGYLLHGKNKTINNVEGYASDIVKKLEENDKEIKDLSYQLEKEKTKHSKATEHIKKSSNENKNFLEKLSNENKSLSEEMKKKDEKIRRLESKNFILEADYRMLKNNADTIMNAMNEYGGTAVGRVLKVNNAWDNPYIDLELNQRYSNYQKEKSGMLESTFTRISSTLDDIKDAKKY